MQFVSGNPACSRLKKRNAPEYDDACGESRFETGGRVPEKSVMNLNDYKTECCAELTLNSYNMDTNIWGGTSPGLLDRIKFLDEYFGDGFREHLLGSDKETTDIYMKEISSLFIREGYDGHNLSKISSQWGNNKFKEQMKTIIDQTAEAAKAKAEAAEAAEAAKAKAEAAEEPPDGSFGGGSALRSLKSRRSWRRRNSKTKKRKYKTKRRKSKSKMRKSKRR
jgi:hypothetical protein